MFIHLRNGVALWIDMDQLAKKKKEAYSMIDILEVLNELPTTLDIDAIIEKLNWFLADRSRYLLKDYFPVDAGKEAFTNKESFALILGEEYF